LSDSTASVSRESNRQVSAERAGVQVENMSSLDKVCPTNRFSRAMAANGDDFALFTLSSQFKYNRRDARATLPAGKMIHLRITSETVKELEEVVKKLQSQYPDREVFIDGDEFAVCSTPKKEKK